MNCQELLSEQVNLLKAVNPTAKVFVYRNSVKALPWFTDVRVKLDDPAYAGWFLKFNSSSPYHVPNCTTSGNSTKCSNFYHDQEQTPSTSAGWECLGGVCDCGDNPCGEYLFDFRNDSLAAYLTGEYILGPTALGNPNISGFFFDDQWYDKPTYSGMCSASPYGGPTEIDSNCIQDMGLSQQDVTDITTGWQATMNSMYQVLQDHGGFAYQWFNGGGYGPTTPTTPAACLSYYREACSPSSPFQTAPLMYPFTKNANGAAVPLPNFAVDLASFLLVRGPYAWLGYNWEGCNVEYEFPEPLTFDYGVPTGVCQETVPGQSGIFIREWTKANITINCNTFDFDIVM
jgi:hypothetical protein